MSPKEETPRFANKQLLKATSPDFIRNRKKASFCAKWTFCCQESATYWISPGGESPGQETNSENTMLGKVRFFIF